MRILFWLLSSLTLFMISYPFVEFFYTLPVFGFISNAIGETSKYNERTGSLFWYSLVQGIPWSVFWGGIGIV